MELNPTIEDYETFPTEAPRLCRYEESLNRLIINPEITIFFGNTSQDIINSAFEETMKKLESCPDLKLEIIKMFTTFQFLGLKEINNALKAMTLI